MIEQGNNVFTLQSGTEQRVIIYRLYVVYVTLLWAIVTLEGY